MPALLKTIDVDELRLGMHIQLDLGWISHPFPLSSFRITHLEQIETLRSLGLSQVRWSPERSEILPPPLPGAAQARAAAGQESAAAVVADAAQASPDDADPGAAEDDEARARGPATLEREAAEQAVRRKRREALQAQRHAAQQCERQYGEAALGWRQAADLVVAHPRAARERTEALTRALLDKMAVDRELSIRLLTECSGERSTAHVLNVTVISMLMARLFNLTDSEMLDLGTGALMHDIGKIDLPDRLRHDGGRLTPAEQLLYREHVHHGVMHGRKMGLSPGALLVVAQHHEQADGSGFPQSLHIDRITAAARIVALVNRYDNLCNPPAATQAMTPHEALSLLFAQGKDKFDATMLNAFIRMMGVYPPGSLVQLTDDRFGLVMTVNSARPLKPRVLLHDPATPRDEALYLDLETAPGLGIRRSLRPPQLPPAALEYLSPRQRVTYFFEPAPSRSQEMQEQAA